MKYDRDGFVARANEVHGGKYDYSAVEYVDDYEEVDIICPIHGVFRKRPRNHLHGSGCPKCSKIEAEKKRQATNLERYGATTFAGSSRGQELRARHEGAWSPEARRKATETCIRKFGAKTWAESELGVATARAACSDAAVRAKMSERARSEETRRHYAETSKAHFGAAHWTQSAEGRAKLHDMFSTDDERKARSDRMRSPEVQDKIRTTSIARYGVPYYWQSDEGRARLKVLLNQDSVQQKIIATKRERGTSNSSKPELMAYDLLVERFGKDDVVSQYKSDARYPYACDFYIRSLDLFIELNASWLHGFHWFDETNEDDVVRLQMLLDKAAQGKPLYERAAYIWTYDDLRKRATAEANNLNYIVFWDNDLSDFVEWLRSV